ncbi:MAG: LppX_LprAFG lipoprotein [Pseudonocardiaceae bacterium]
MTIRPQQEERRGLLPGTASVRLTVAVFAALVLTLIASCGGISGISGQQQDNLPDGTQLLTDSAAAMRTVDTTHFTISAQGDIPGVSLRYADGQLTEQGSAKGIARMQQGEKLVEQDFVITGDTLYLRDPAGKYQKLPSSVSGVTYNPAVILNPERGVPAVLSSGKDATTEAREQIAGVDSYRVEATFPRESLSTLVPGVTEDTTGTVWIAAQGSRLVEAQFRKGDGLISARFSDYDVPVTINAPAE